MQRVYTRPNHEIVTFTLFQIQQPSLLKFKHELSMNFCFFEITFIYA